jgi:hypothetical protein
VRFFAAVMADASPMHETVPMRLSEPGDADWAATLRDVAERQRAEVDRHLPDWPVFGLSGGDDGRADERPADHGPADRGPADHGWADDGWADDGWLVGWSEQNGVVVDARIGYGAPADQRWLWVCTQPRTRGRETAVVESLDWLLARMFADDDREYPIAGRLPDRADGIDGGLPPAPHAMPTEIVLDGVPVAGVVQRVDGYVAWRAVRDDVVVTVAGRGVATSLPALVPITDLAPYVERRSVMLGRMADARRTTPAAPLTGPDETAPLWAHRGLVAMTVACHEDMAARRAEHRPPARLDPLWAQRWEAAVRRQRELRDQDHVDARHAIELMVRQLGDLQQRAAWWDDEALRRRAIDEVIWVTVSGESNVGSAAAQELWHRDNIAGIEAWQDWADVRRAD